MARRKRFIVGRENFSRLFSDMQDARRQQDMVVAYYKMLDGITSLTSVPADGRRLRSTSMYPFQAYYDGGNYTIATNIRQDFSYGRPNSPNDKDNIPAIPLPLGDHYITSLKQSIGNNVPKPELRSVSAGMSEDSLSAQNDKRLYAISSLLQRLLVNKLKNGSDNESMRLLERLQEEGMACGTAGLRIGKWQPYVDAPPELTIDFIPYNSILLSASDRFIAVLLEVYKGSMESSEFDFAEKPWEPDESPESSRSYWELYDREERVTYYVADEAWYEVKKREPWPAGLDEPPIVLFSVGRNNGDSPYACGLVERWLPIWEEIVIAVSMLSYESKKACKAKLLTSSLIGENSEDMSALDDPNKWLVNIQGLNLASGMDGMKDQISNHLMPFKHIESIAEWQNWLAELRRMLAEYQYFPDISRGVATQQTAYMKAGTAQTVDQTRARLVGEVSTAFGNMLERLYKHMLDYLGANTDIGSVRELLKDDATVSLLRNDFDISVSITDIAATAEQQDAQKMQMMVQGAPALIQTIEAMKMLEAPVGAQFNSFRALSDIFEKLFGLPLSRYMEPITAQPLIPPGSSSPVAPAEGASTSAPVAPSSGGATDWFYTLLYERGLDYLIDSMTDVDPALIEELASTAQQLSGDQQSLGAFLSELESALGAGDIEGELVSLLRRFA